MSDEYEYDTEGDVSLDVDEKNVGGATTEEFKMTHKGQTVRAAFVYFHTVDANAVSAAVKKAKAGGKNLSKEEIVEVAKAALAKRAETAGKPVDKLTAADKLDLGVAHFKSMKAHYQDGIGFVMSRLGKDGADADAIWKRLGDPRAYFSTLLLIYPTNSEGGLNKEEFGAQVKGGKLKLIRWRFGKKTYDGIWKQNDALRANNIALASQDVNLECKEPKYQNIEVSATGPAIWLKNDVVKAAVLAQAVGMYDKLIPFREMTTDQLRAKLGLGTSGSDDVSSGDFQDMLDQV